MLEKIEKKLKKFNGKVIGYEFKKIENKRITEISKTNFDNASKIFMFTINMNRALGEIKEDEKLWRRPNNKSRWNIQTCSNGNKRILCHL